MSDSDLTTPISSSKLIPAAAPTVSAWGKKLEVPTTSASPQNIKKEEWPTVDVVLSKDISHSAAKEVEKEKPKVKSTGKEKWIPYDATIILPSGNNGNQQKKKNSSNGNSNNSKKKQGQNSSNQNSNGKQKKDGSTSKNSQNNQKKQSDGNQNQQQKKRNNGQSNGANKQSSTKSVSEGVASLNLKKEKKEATAEAPSTANSVSPGTLPAVPATSDVTPTTQNAKLSDEAESATTGTTPATNASESTDASPSIDNSTTNKDAGANGKQPPAPQQYQPQIPPSQQYLQQQHRNSEPFGAVNGSYIYNNGNRGRKQSNKQFNNHMRHSIAGAGYNVPYYNYNYGYMPMLSANQFGYPVPYNNFAKPGSRSQSQSPNKGDFSASLSMGSPNIPGLPPFAPQPMAFNPYTIETDPLTTVVNQLNYYFSNENLIKDFYLRRQMNSNGFVPLKRLIEFNRLKALTGGDYDMMLNALKLSPNLEVHNDKVRLIGNWNYWVLPYEQRDEAGQLEDEETSTDENKS